MEINPGGVLFGFLIVYAIGVLIVFVLISALSALNVIRVKSFSFFITWSLVGSLVLNILFWTIKCGAWKKKEDAIIIAPSIDSAH